MAVIRRLPGRARPHEEVLREHQESNASRPCWPWPLSGSIQS
jgi:hypothetical protein